MTEKLAIKVGKNHTLSEIVQTLIDFNYSENENLNLPGEFRRLGGTLAIFPVNEGGKIILDFFGNEIESITDSKKITHEEITVLPNYLILSSGAKIRPGDYLVHEDHGVGCFERVGLRKVGDVEISYLFIQYLNNDQLFVPAEQAAKLSPYIGIGKRAPKLSKLGSQSWKRTYKKVYEDVVAMARELLHVYASRELIKKKPREINSDWDDYVKGSFEFIETEDQLRAIGEVYSDLKCDRPMDRLVCGDVGFGKTEVALRAAVQTIANGYQVAFLVPTTILAEQHYATLMKRVSGLPIRVERISRFLSKSDQTKIIKDVKEGRVDLLIGTHKMLQGNLDFPNLGLLVIDEEQKFGVKDKEMLKKIRKDIDVLTLTATPIPRTLFMSLSGIRDISQISSVPTGRKPIITKVIKYDEVLIKESIQKEIARNGQIYYLHNDVRTIVGKAKFLERMFPNVEVAVGHGQLPENVLAKTMLEFASGKIQLLVCSTIIENGLDLPNVNTLIVDESDKFGLSQLYQIRGRIGRSKKQSYALFTYRNKELTPMAIKRLKALADNIELGTGYNIAISDLEIRGGGNILGREQHGNMEAVGLMLYSKMLNLAVSKIRNKTFDPIA